MRPPDPSNEKSPVTVGAVAGAGSNHAAHFTTHPRPVRLRTHPIFEGPASDWRLRSDDEHRRARWRAERIPSQREALCRHLRDEGHDLEAAFVMRDALRRLERARAFMRGEAA